MSLLLAEFKITRQYGICSCICSMSCCASWHRKKIAQIIKEQDSLGESLFPFLAEFFLPFPSLWTQKLGGYNSTCQGCTC